MYVDTWTNLYSPVTIEPYTKIHCIDLLSVFSCLPVFGFGVGVW